MKTTSNTTEATAAFFANNKTQGALAGAVAGNPTAAVRTLGWQAAIITACTEATTYNWNSKSGQISVDDGTMTFHLDDACLPDSYDMEDIAREFVSAYDHNGCSGWVFASITDNEVGEVIQFAFDESAFVFGASAVSRITPGEASNYQGYQTSIASDPQYWGDEATEETGVQFAEHLKSRVKAQFPGMHVYVVPTVDREDNTYNEDGGYDDTCRMIDAWVEENWTDSIVA